MRKLLSSLLTVCLLVGVAFASDKKPITDDCIHDDVQVRLAADTVVKGGGIAVQVVNGVVTLSGQVATPKAKTKAATIAKKVKGVKSVTNNIVVTP